MSGGGDKRVRQVARSQPFTPRPGAADQVLVPGPGETSCPLCGLPGYAVIDAKGVRVYHPRSVIPHRHAGRFSALVSVPDPARQAAWTDAAPAEVCARCAHTRERHDDPAAPGEATPCTGCECPGPAAVTP